jgi:hypothetical protein
VSMDMKRGDLEPGLVLTVEDAAGDADLTQVESWRILGKLRGELVVDDAPDTVTPEPGNTAKTTLARAWVTGETDDVGDMQIEAEATWPGGRRQTFPADGYEVVRIRADLG